MAGTRVRTPRDRGAGRHSDTEQAARAQGDNLHLPQPRTRAVWVSRAGTDVAPRAPGRSPPPLHTHSQPPAIPNHGGVVRSVHTPLPSPSSWSSPAANSLRLVQPAFSRSRLRLGGIQTPFQVCASAAHQTTSPRRPRALSRPPLRVRQGAQVREPREDRWEM